METATDFPENWPFRLSLRTSSPSSPLASDEDQLVAAASSGDDEAYVLLVERHQEKIFRFCCQWLPNAEDAREATQDTFVRAYLALGRYRKKGRFSSWLFQIALNQCRDRYRSKAGQQHRSTDSFDVLSRDLVCATAHPDESTSRTEEQARLHDAIGSLPEKLRAVAILCGIERLSHRQCAEILNCSERAIEGRFYRAKQALAAWFEANGGR